MFVFTHEAQNVISSLDTHANELESLIDSPLLKKSSVIQDIANNFRETRDRFDEQLNIFGLLSKDIINVKRKRLSILNISKKVLTIFKGLINDFNIKIENNILKSHRTGPMLEAELYSVLINLLSNAIKAVLAEKGSFKKILIETERKKNELILRVYDDGVGLAPEYRETVLLPLVSDPEGKLYKRLEDELPKIMLNAIGSGRGLGLSIISDVLLTYNKQLRFIDTESPWKTCVEVELP